MREFKRVCLAAVSAAAFGAAAFEFPPPPAAPSPKDWVFERELSRPEANPPPDVAVDPATGKPRRFWLKDRISRCFFGPIKRAPYFRDELMDDVDYYPDEYLKRLKREGVNGLWLTVEIADLAETSFTPRSPDAGKRYAKLNRTVEKCARHGIGIWIFMIEPQFKPSNPMVKSHPHCFGPQGWNGNHLACTATPEIRKYLEEAAYDIFSHAPGLAGCINISHGERPTTCLSGVRFAEVEDGGEVRSQCPRCGGLKPWQMHLNTVEPLIKGMRRANPKARLISWFYEPQKTTVQNRELAECAKHLPEGVTFQCNFESGCVKIQNGKRRVGGDYWLAEPGPGEPFKKVAAAAREAGARLSAKIQAISSHENACIPYVPVPGLLYRKFKAMHGLGVESSMLCWYFGNYPGLMNRAAGMLACSDFRESEDEFLVRLAKEGGWGDEAASIAKIWKALSDAYVNYPLTNFMQYYGPFHFGFVFPLHPKVELKPLSPTWKPDYPPSGDTIGECLGDFTLDEVIELAGRMQIDGSEFPRLRAKFAGNRERLLDLGVMETLRYQFMSALDVFAFYKARDVAVRRAAAGDFAAALEKTREMRAIVEKERGISRAMIPLCEADGRLGFHSEAEAHRFHPALLKWRIGVLDLADAELDEIDESLKAGRGYVRSAMELSSPTMQVAADGTVDLAPLAGTNASVYVVTMDETGVTMPVERKVDFKPGARYKLPPNAERIFSYIQINGVEDIDKSSEPVWPKVRYPYRHRLNIHCSQGCNFGRLVRPGSTGLYPGRAVRIAVAAGADAKKAIESFYGRTHGMRFEYVILPRGMRTLEFCKYGSARSALTFEEQEIAGLESFERFLDFSRSAKRTRAGELAHAIAAATPFMLLACDPSVYFASDAQEFIKSLPTVYDETVPLKGGAVARRAGGDWYVAFENVGETPVAVEIDLSFLGGGLRHMTSFGKVRSERKVSAGERFIVEVGARDGFAARLSPPISLFFAGDSTLSPRRSWKPNGSWGDALKPYLSEDVRIVNCAVGGRSTKSFRSHWDRELIPFVSEGDWVLIEFGPNDAVKNQPYRSCTPEEYAVNLKRYAAELRAKGAKPLFVSSITDRRWGKYTKWPDKAGLQPYIDAMAKAAEEDGVPFVEMQEPTAAVVKAAGPEGSKRLFKCGNDGKDNVHPSKVGARLFAKAFVETLAKMPDHPAHALFRPAGRAP